MTYLLTIFNFIIYQTLLFFSFVQRNKDKKKLIYFGSISAIVLLCLCLCVNQSLCIPLFGLQWNVTIALILGIDLLLFLPIVTKKNKVIAILLLPFLIDFISKILLVLFFKLPFAEVNKVGYFYFSFLLILLQIFIEIVIFIVYHLIVKIYLYKENITSLLILISLVIVELIAFFLINYNLSSLVILNQSSFMYIVLFNIVLIVLFVITIVSAYFLEKNIQKKYQQINQYKENILEMNFQKIYIESQEQLFMMRHDIANVIESIQTYNNPETEEIKNNLAAAIRETKVFYTNHKLLNSILVNKMHEAKNSSIEIQPSVQIHRDLNIANNDLISLICNLLDNSMEAVRDLENKTIGLEIGTTDTTLDIMVENAYSSNTKKKKENPQYHGFGLKIIQSIVSKYHGTYKVEKTNTNFITIIRIKV